MKFCEKCLEPFEITGTVNHRTCDECRADAQRARYATYQEKRTARRQQEAEQRRLEKRAEREAYEARQQAAAAGYILDLGPEPLDSWGPKSLREIADSVYFPKDYWRSLGATYPSERKSA